MTNGSLKKKFISSQIKTKKPLEIKIFHDLKAKKKKKKKKKYIYMDAQRIRVNAV